MLFPMLHLMLTILLATSKRNHSSLVCIIITTEILLKRFLCYTISSLFLCPTNLLTLRAFHISVLFKFCCINGIVTFMFFSSYVESPWLFWVSRRTIFFPISIETVCFPIAAGTGMIFSSSLTV